MTHSALPPPAAADALADFIDRHPRLFVLTGAGCSTDSGIPDYRDGDGAWKRKPPVTYQAFTQDPLTRGRYWARSLVGWPMFARARPNGAHAALAALDMRGRITRLVTQNVDGLHQAAGSREVIELHGGLSRIVCLGCGAIGARAGFQQRMEALNPGWLGLSALAAPDGDADLEGLDFASFAVPDCELCGGMLKPDVVFFGEGVPPARVQAAMDALDAADAMLVVGSSLMVYSGYRFALRAADRAIPIAAINLGRTRADGLFTLKVEASCADALGAL